MTDLFGKACPEYDVETLCELKPSAAALGQVELKVNADVGDQFEILSF